MRTAQETKARTEYIKRIAKYVTLLAEKIDDYTEEKKDISNILIDSVNHVHQDDPLKVAGQVHCIPFQSCPTCSGEGTISTIPLGTTAASELCPTCEGERIIPMAVVPGYLLETDKNGK